MSLTVLLIGSVLMSLTIGYVSGRKGYGPGEQDWGFIDIREGAHMFYWLYYSTADAVHYTESPLVIWIQGGPGSSSTGFGNFYQLGPVDASGTPRNYSWVKNMNVLFIDSPVGSGFSYVDNTTFLTYSNNGIASDLIVFMKRFYELHPEFETIPLHIFGVSYGGKMAPEFALELYNAVEKGELRSNLNSITMGAPWISPIDLVLEWAPLLLSLGIIDLAGYTNIMAAAHKTADLVNAKNWSEATIQWSRTQRIVLLESKGIDFYNFQKPTAAKRYQQLFETNDTQEMFKTIINFNLDDDSVETLIELMRGPVSRKLGIPLNVQWGSQSRLTFFNLIGDFMKPAVDIIQNLLDHTDLKVGIISGQLDLICSTAGTINWIHNMEWSYKNEFMAAQRSSISVDDILEGYEKSFRDLSLYIIYRAGHIVPSDNPAAMSYILNQIIN